MIEKPVYSASKRTYVCEIRDGLRFTKEVQPGEPTLDTTQALHDALIGVVCKEASGFFSKPLKESDIRAKLKVQVLPAISQDVVLINYTMVWSSLEISQNQFLCIFTVESKIPVVVPVAPLITFEDSQEYLILEEPDLETIPLEIASVFPIENVRAAAKEKIRRARIRAAKAILRSEQLTKEFIGKWGEPESDWESESDDGSSMNSD